MEFSQGTGTGEWLTTKEAAQQLELSEQMVRIHLRSGALKASKVGQTWVILPEDLKEFAEKPRPTGRPRKVG